jgi:hypothetical protein
MFAANPGPMKTMFLSAFLFFSLNAHAAKIPETPEEKICKKDLIVFAIEEANSVAAEAFPEELQNQIDRTKETKCEVEIKTGTLVIGDRTSTFCQATADFVGECFYPKKGGGFLSRLHHTEGSGCCMIEQ